MRQQTRLVVPPLEPTAARLKRDSLSVADLELPISTKPPILTLPAPSLLRIDTIAPRLGVLSELIVLPASLGAL